MVVGEDRIRNGEAEPNSSPAQQINARGERESRFIRRTIGIYGPRAAGKTCYLAVALLGKSASRECTVLLADDNSRELLEPHWEALKHGAVPQSTELSFADIKGSIVISSCVECSTEARDDNPDDPGEADSVPDSDDRGSNKKRRIPFETADFGGRLAERGDTGLPELTEKFRDWLENAHCLLFVLATDQLQNPEEARERLLEVDALLSRLAEAGLEGHAIAKPIAILITKWDLVSDLSGSLEEEREKFRRFLETHAGDLATTVYEKIANAGERVEVFPVSAFGGHVDGRPVYPLKPFNLHAPLVWCLQQTDWYLYEEKRREAEEALTDGNGIWKVLTFGKWKNYAGAIGCYQQLIKKYGISAGPVHDEIQQELRPLKDARRDRNLRLAIALASILLLLLAAATHEIDRRKYWGVMNDLKDGSKSYPELQTEVTQYLNSLNPWARLLGHKRIVAQKWDEYQEEYKKKHDEEFAHLEQLRTQAFTGSASVADFINIINKCEHFLGNHPQSPKAPIVKGWLEETKGLGRAEDAKRHAQEVLDQPQVDTDQLARARDELIKVLQDLEEAGNNSEFIIVRGLVQQLRYLLHEVEDVLKQYTAFDQAFAKLLTDLEQLPAEEGLIRIRNFREEYPEDEYPRAGDKYAILDTREQSLRRQLDQKAWSAVDEAYKSFERDADKKPIEEVRREYIQLIAQLENYIKQTERAPLHVEEAHELKRNAFTILDNAEWRAVEEFKRENPKAYDEVAARALEYLRWAATEKNAVGHEEDAKATIRESLLSHWREQYRAFFDRAGKVKDPRTFQEARDKAKESLEWVNRKRREYEGLMPDDPAFEEEWKAVQDWVAWCDEFFDGKPHIITVTADFTRLTKYKSRFTISRIANVGPSNSPEWEVLKTSEWFSGGKGDVTVTIPNTHFTETVRIGYEIDDLGFNTTGESKPYPLIVLVFQYSGQIRVPVKEYENKSATFTFYEHNAGESGKKRELKPPELPLPGTSG